jgi:hypothetical protein
MASCRSCPASVVWFVTTRDKRMPLDPTPTPDGNVRLITTTGDNQRRAQVLGGVELDQARAEGIALYTAHFATCPSAEAHRRRATRAGAR